MAQIEVEWLSDQSDCDDCGMNWAEGARVTLDGALILDLQPIAACFNGQHFPQEEVFRRIFEHLGHTLTEI